MVRPSPKSCNAHICYQNRSGHISISVTTQHLLSVHWKANILGAATTSCFRFPAHDDAVSRPSLPEMRDLNHGGASIWRKCSILARNLWARHSSTKLFVGGLSYDTNEPVLKDAFGKHGEIIEVKVICDHVSGKSKGYGFVKFTSEVEASTALKEMDGQLLDGRQIRLEFAHKG